MAVGLRDVGCFDLCGSLRSVAGAGGQDELCRANERGKMMMVRERAGMVRETAIGMVSVVGRLCQADWSVGRFGIRMERREQVKAEIPNKYEQHHEGAMPPEKRHGLREGSPVPSDPKSHVLYLPSRLSQLDARSIVGLPESSGK